MIVGQTGCGKSWFVMDLINGEYKNFFSVIMIICPTFKHNETYKAHSDIFHYRARNSQGTKIFFDDLKEGMADPIDALEFYTRSFKGTNTLFILDDLAEDQCMDKKRTALGKMAISGRHYKHSMWVITQKYNSINTQIRQQSQWICSFYCKSTRSFNDMLDDNEAGIKKEDRGKILDHLKKEGGKLLLFCTPPNVCHRLV